MLESVLADVLTRVLGQYLQGIDRDSVRFGAWSGLVELRGVALRPEALAVLFETLGMDLPVTVEAGFIGLLRLQVPWNAIGTTPVQIHMSDITVMARPVRGDGSDDSELQLRERRIKRAKLNTDDAVREASWGVGRSQTSTDSSPSWGNWLVSDELRAKIIDNIQIHLSDILIRFEDPLSDPRRPYIASIFCQSLKAVSANDLWQETFVERSTDTPHLYSRKLLEVKGFRIDWAPITPHGSRGLSSGTGDRAPDATRFQTLESLKEFMTEEGVAADSSDEGSGVRTLLHPVDGSMRLRLTSSTNTRQNSEPAGTDAAVDLDIRFPNVIIDLDDVEYACLLQSSVYFARLSTRGFRPSSPKARWSWAVNQLLPGFSRRRANTLRYNEESFMKAWDRAVLYAARRKSVLKARRMGMPEPTNITDELEKLEDELSYEQVLAMRDLVDRQIEVEGEDWTPLSESPPAVDGQSKGTTIGSFWSMLGYKDDNADTISSTASSSIGEKTQVVQGPPGRPPGQSEGDASTMLALRASFLLQNASVRLSQHGFPKVPVPRVALNLCDLRCGVQYTYKKGIIVEALLGSIEAWDLQRSIKMVYSKTDTVCRDGKNNASDVNSAYPFEVSDAIYSIRRGLNPATELLGNDVGDDEDDKPEYNFDDSFFGQKPEQMYEDDENGRREHLRDRPRETSTSRESTPGSTFQVTETEFFGTPTDAMDTQRYVAAFRYVQSAAEHGESHQPTGAKLDVSIATLEAIVDGPKGCFVWGLKFWRPKGMAQDPIMAFLGAAAGARIAELRMELEEALLASKVPMQINAVILAPRFIFPSSSGSSAAIVVNMGTLGICTSDSTRHDHSVTSKENRKRLRYSNYVLTLDDLGMYFSPSATSAVSSGGVPSNKTADDGKMRMDNTSFSEADASRIERIIKPFSLRFILQTLRDATVVQVAHAPISEEEHDTEKIAKVRIRGDVPGLYLILSRKALQHLILEGRIWSSQLRPNSTREASTVTTHPSGEKGWAVGVQQDSNLAAIANLGNTIIPEERRSEESSSITNPHPAVLASYNIRLQLKKVSVELRETADLRLVTAVASSMCARVVKTSRTELRSKFSLRSWSVTDGSRGRTAAFRGLVHAGSLNEPKGVSPPRSLAGTPEDLVEDYDDNKNFINIEYDVNFAKKERKIHLQVLSLKMICVRETYVRMASFFFEIHKRAKAAFQAMKGVKDEEDFTNVKSTHESTSGIVEDYPTVNAETLPSHPTLQTSITAEFDGFNIQLVALGGVIAMVEMKESKIQFFRDHDSRMRMSGDFRYFCVRDYTAPISEHAFVISYDKQLSSGQDSITMQAADEDLQRDGGDRWTLVFPDARSSQYLFTARFKGIHICLLYRFSVVLEQYFSVLRKGIAPVMGAVFEEVEKADSPSLGQSISQTASRTSCFQVDLQFCNLQARVPRHSGCASELMTIDVSEIKLTNFGKSAISKEWFATFEGVDFALQYTVPSAKDPTGESVVKAPFLKGLAAELVFRKEHPAETNEEVTSQSLVEVRILNNVLLELCEAQYTVLYFVLTENFAETINGVEVAADLSDVRFLESPDVVSDIGTAAEETHIETEGSNPKPIDGLSGQSRKTIATAEIFFPSLSIEFSRGWDVSQTVCKIIGLCLNEVRLCFKYHNPPHILLEATGNLLSGSDLRQEGRDISPPFIAPLNVSMEQVAQPLQTENFSMIYEKESGNRPVIVVSFIALQFEIVPELLRDLTYLAVPGWPYLRTSPSPPEFVYVGRSLNILMSKSQVLLYSDEFDGDQRAIVWTGEHQLKVDWMRGTGAKQVTLRSSCLEVAASSAFPFPEKHETFDTPHGYLAKPFDKTETPLLYPTNFTIDYVGPNADDSGCRLNMEADSMLCLVNAAEVSLVRAVLSRPNRLTPSYLASRDWTQPSVLGPPSGNVTPNLKEERMRKALENMSISLRVPTARYLLTDNMDGRFVPVLETCISSLILTAHLGNMVQVAGEISLFLFNKGNGSWEPALEPWQLAASISWGHSGTRAIVLKSDGRLNINIAPTSFTAAATVAKAVRTATRKVQGMHDTEKVSPCDETNRGTLHSKDTSATDVRRPTVAAFLVRNELGCPVVMNLIGSSRKMNVGHGTEIEVGAQSEELVSSSAPGQSKTRAEALKCMIAVPGFAAQELSASLIGKHYLTYHPIKRPVSSQGELFKASGDNHYPISILWEVVMMNGVPLCTLRSLVRIRNELGTPMEIHFMVDKLESGDPEGESSICIEAGGCLSVPMKFLQANIEIRPNAANLFEWSSPLPRLPWLYKNARSSVEQEQLRKALKSPNASSDPQKDTIVKCKTAQVGASDFFVRVASVTPNVSRSRDIPMSSWIDVILRAPVLLRNKLPCHLSYRVTAGRITPTLGKNKLHSDGAVIAAGVIPPQEEAHLHVSSKDLNSLSLSFAYDNIVKGNSPSHGSASSRASSENRAPSRFGNELSLDMLVVKKAAAVLPSFNFSDSKANGRKEFRATVAPQSKGEPYFNIYAGFWIRNRSDTPLEVCSRSSYYGSGTQPIHLPEQPPMNDPDNYICLEGPYLSIKPSNEHNAGRPSDSFDQSDWWTIPSALEDINKPMEVSIGGRSLEVDVRPAAGNEGHTFIITIRNSSWICNNTPSVLQWCESGALDSHGNCVTRFLRSLKPGQVQAIHWGEKSIERAIHLRLAEEDGQSDWIWSPAIPLNIGHSRELPAKMYRPKTHEQYIARVASKELAGGSHALAVYAEDKQHPPYRIVNLCNQRAVAFHQVRSQERPWLVRAGKTTRYSWDNPLAHPDERILSIRILEPEELVIRRESRASQFGLDGQAHLHEKCNLNIDVVGDRVMVLSETYVPTLVVNVSVDGATKIVTFCEEDESGKVIVKQESSTQQTIQSERVEVQAVPTVGWDDIGPRSGRSSLTSNDQIELPACDYPPMALVVQDDSRVVLTKSRDMDATFFMDSIGISVITRDPCELLYTSFKGVLINYESYSNLECLAFHVREFQVDNQLERTPYPVLIWIPPTKPSSDASTDPLNGDNSISIEVQREPSGDDILMIRSFQGSIRPFNVCFEDNFVSKFVEFLADTSIVKDGRGKEALLGEDIDQGKFKDILLGSNYAGASRSAREQGLSSSRRIYVHEFTLASTGLRLTSSGSGSAIARAAGINSSARALVALILNVENCHFSFSALNVKNVFDSLHHFTVLVKDYYVTQLSNQRMNLLASNSFVGNPAALFDAVGTGARDFFSEPGRAKGSADFIASVGRGSKSLLTHTVGGLMGSVSSIPRAVSSGLEKAVGDNEYLAERERIRGSNLPSGIRGSSAKNPAQGLATGAISFVHGISSGVTGFVREPVRGAKQGGAGGLLKGIGKAFIGGVAKPVAGAIDLVAEPAAGLSRQIADHDKGINAQPEDPIPERPPRTFLGRSQRLDVYRRRESVGNWLYRAVQLTSGVSYDSELVDWVELSDRTGRIGEGSELWVWSVVQRYSRSMPGAKNKSKTDINREARNQLSDVKPEKIRVALVTMTDLVIATLDCKLVTTVPFWKDCTYVVTTDAKEVLLRTKRIQGADSQQEGIGLLLGAQSLIAAPWDVAVERRRKPNPGEELVDHIPCGSPEAAGDLCQVLRDVIQRIEVSNSSMDPRTKKLDGDSSSSVELTSLSSLPKMEEGWQEMKSKLQPSESARKYNVDKFSSSSEAASSNEGARGSSMQSRDTLGTEAGASSSMQRPEETYQDNMAEERKYSTKESKRKKPREAERSDRRGMSDDELSLQQLMDIGFKFEDAVVALAEAGGDMVKAVDILTR